MADARDTKNNLIKQVFNTMDYGEESENLTEAIEWLKKKENSFFSYIDKPDEAPNGEALSVKNATNKEHLYTNYVPESSTINAILKNASERKNSWIEISPIKRAEIIYKLATEIQKKQNLFIQLEIVARGILGKDTKAKTLPLLTDYLHYYSGFSVKHSVENPIFTPKGLTVAILPDFNSLAVLGLILGPCLSSGSKIIIQTGPHLTLILTLFTELALQVGIPEGTIRIIPGNIDPNIFFTYSEVSTIAIFDDLHKEQYLFANHFNKKILHFNSSGTRMIVFNDCDLDSACHSVVDTAFSYKGMLPWATRNVFVQEDIFDVFTRKLKHKTDQLKIGTSGTKNIDATYPDDGVLEKITKIVEEAKNAGVEVYQPNTNSVVPTLLIGSNVFPNNVIKEDFINVPIVTVVAFRSINEAVSLSNNSRQGLGISVWTESTSLVNEIMGKLKFGNIWVNSHGLFAANISTSPFKTSGNGYFGGIEGFYEYTDNKSLKDESPPVVSKCEIMEKAISDAKKGSAGWAKLTHFERSKSLQQTAQGLQKKWDLPESWVHQWVTLIYECVLYNLEGFTNTKTFNVLNMREPHGVVAVETSENKDEHNKRLIIAALNVGNSVIILNRNDETSDFYSYLSKSLPNGVLTVIRHFQDAVKVAALHKELNVYFGVSSNKVFGSLPLKSSSKFKVVNLESWEEARSKVSLVKNVWLNKGQSFI